MCVCVCFRDHGTTGCCLGRTISQDYTSKASPCSTGWILRQRTCPCEINEKLRNYIISIQFSFSIFENCKFACKLQSWGTQQFLNQILFLLQNLCSDSPGISTGKTFTISGRWYGNNPFESPELLPQCPLQLRPGEQRSACCLLLCSASSTLAVRCSSLPNILPPRASQHLPCCAQQQGGAWRAGRKVLPLCFLW